MNELMNVEFKKPLDRSLMGNDAAALNALVGFLNDPRKDPSNDPLEVSPNTTVGPSGETLIAQDPLTAALPAPKAAPVAPAPAFIPPEDNLNKLFFTGRLCIGKDYLASAVGATVFGFADPLYKIAEYFFGVPVTANTNKDIPGMRAFLQAVGQWGRNLISEQYPVTPARGLFVHTIRKLGTEIDPEGKLCVEWENYGKDENIWVNSALARIRATEGLGRIATTNVRFNNEFKMLQADGWTHFHVMSTPKEWAERLAKRNLKPESPVLKDTSEKLASSLDQNVIKQISANKTGPKLHVIWNSAAPPPSNRLWTVAEFLHACSVTPATQSAEDFILQE